MKKVFSFTLDEGIIKELDDFCKDGLITKSKLVNKIIQDYIQKEKNKKEYEENL
jgi:metal-responsive CopG/Arc/MetJ family transcriptional regulator